MNEAIIYRRVSSRRQSDEGKSLEDQDAELAAYCAAFNYRLIGNYQDAVSGRREKTERRVGLTKALALACERKATLIVYDLDRLARSQSVGMRLIEQIHDCGAKLVVKSLGVDTNTPAGELIAGIMLCVAQWGSRNIGVGVKRANTGTVKRLGYRTQGVQPAGWMIDEETKLRTPCAPELAVIARVSALTSQRPRLSLASIAEALNAEGVPTIASLRGGEPVPWTKWSARAIVERQKLTPQSVVIG